MEVLTAIIIGVIIVFWICGSASILLNHFPSYTNEIREGAYLTIAFLLGYLVRAMD
jgi:hypothetical protein